MDKPILKEEAERTIEAVSDLISDRKFMAWYYKRLYVLGVDKFLSLATEARNAMYPPRKFSSLLKRTKG